MAVLVLSAAAARGLHHNYRLDRRRAISQERRTRRALAWQRFGQLPASPVLLVVIALGTLADLALPGNPPTPVYFMLAVWVAYCVARPRDGVEVFFTAAIPSAASSLAHDILDVPRLAVSLPLLPVALLMLRAIDRRGTPTARGDAGKLVAD